MTNNILQFPKQFTSPQEREELKRDLLIDVALDLSIGVYNKLDVYVECLDDPEDISSADFTLETKKDMILIHESIKSCLYRLHKKDHPLQDISDEYMPELPELRFEMMDDYDE